MEPFVLFIYLASWSTNGGMTVTSQEFLGEDACRSASSIIIQRFAGVYTRVFWTCVGKNTGKEVGHGQS